MDVWILSYTMYSKCHATSYVAGILAYLQLVEQSAKLDATIHDFIAENRPKHEGKTGSTSLIRL